MADTTDFSKIEPEAEKVPFSPLHWRPAKADELELLYHWAYAPFFVFAECQACGHRSQLDMAALIEKKRCGHCSVAWLKARLACTNHNCRTVGQVQLQFQRKPMKPLDPIVTPLGGRGVVHGPAPDDIEQRRLKDWSRRHSRRRNWHRKDQPGEAQR